MIAEKLHKEKNISLQPFIRNRFYTVCMTKKYLLILLSMFVFGGALLFNVSQVKAYGDNSKDLVTYLAQKLHLQKHTTPVVKFRQR
jgi:hypothetical protein